MIKTQFNELETVVTLTLGDGNGNIINLDLIQELDKILRSFANIDTLKIIVLQGEGKHFSFGASVEEHQREYVHYMLQGFHKIFYTLKEISIPALAKVSGQCLGGGLEIALMCNFIFADQSARLGQPEISLGVFPPPASIILPEKIGLAKAEELLITGRILHSIEAFQLGLINKVFEDRETLNLETNQWIETNILPKSASSLRYAVKASRVKFNHILGNFLPQLESIYLHQLMATHDANEGIEAFLNKRSPEWQNN